MVTKSSKYIGIVGMVVAAFLAVALFSQNQNGPRVHVNEQAQVSQQSEGTTNEELKGVPRSSSEMRLDAGAPDELMTLTLGEHNPQDGDVVSQWGDFVVFKEIATNCGYVTRKVIRENAITNHVEWHCDSRELADHPYEFLDNSQLEQIAETDGVAALILGLRLRNQAQVIEEYQESIRYLYSAVLLTGEPQAFETLMTQQNIAIGVSYANNEPDSTANADAYVWTRAGQYLGLFDDDKITRVRESVANDAKLDIEYLDSMAIELAKNFNYQRQSLIGETFR